MTRARNAAARFAPRRRLLLAEIARRCRGCDSPARIGLTKEEARTYHGFECARCEAWNEDELTERDIPEWSQEQDRESVRGREPRASEAPADSTLSDRFTIHGF